MSQQQTQKRPAVVITADQFTQLMNHFLINLGLFVSTKQVEESKAEGAPSTQGFSVILGQQVNTKSEAIAVLNTYCENVNLIANKELGMVAQCEILLGEKSTLPNEAESQDIVGTPDAPEADAQLGAPVDDSEDTDQPG